MELAARGCSLQAHYMNQAYSLEDDVPPPETEKLTRYNNYNSLTDNLGMCS